MKANKERKKIKLEELLIYFDIINMTTKALRFKLSSF